MMIEALPVGPLQVNCYIVGCEKTREALVIDPGDEGERILAALDSAGLQAKLVINTHGHFDHIGANAYLLEKTGAELLIHEKDVPLLAQSERHAELFGLSVVPSPAPTRTLSGGEELSVGELRIRVIHTPGHSPGGICLLVDDHLFAGDTLFAGSIGRTDLAGGNHEQLLAAIREHLLVLPEGTTVYPGHGPDTSIGREKRSNPFVGAFI
jgi:glyoxylase-like metal-dependent hydrolase (beta-lactamase superfamily II)